MLISASVSPGVVCMWCLVYLLVLLTNVPPTTSFVGRGSFPLPPALLRQSTALLASKNTKKKTGGGGGGAAASLPPVASTAPPQRVTTNSNVPVRQQIAWAKAYKRLTMSNGFNANKNGVGKKFRQEKGEKEEEEAYVEIDYVNTKPPALFVDGYNVIGYINTVEGRRVSLDEARDCLIADLSVLRGATGWFIEVIFDAYKRTESVDSLLVTYTSMAETADNYIERRFSELSAEGFNNMVVVTDDNVLRMVAGAVSAGYLSASMLVEELRIAYLGWEATQEDLQREAQRARPRLGDSLSAETRGAIDVLKAEAAKERAAAKLEAEMAAAWAYKEQLDAGVESPVVSLRRPPLKAKAEVKAEVNVPQVDATGDAATATSTAAPATDNKVKTSKHGKDSYLSNRKADIEGFMRHKIGKRPTIGDSLSDDMKAIIAKMKAEADAKGK